MTGEKDLKEYLNKELPEVIVTKLEGTYLVWIDLSYLNKNSKIYADISSDLLVTIFFPNNPLHDGGVIIQGDKLTCAGAVFKTSMNPNVNKIVHNKPIIYVFNKIDKGVF